MADCGFPDLAWQSRKKRKKHKRSKKNAGKRFKIDEHCEEVEVITIDDNEVKKETPNECDKNDLQGGFKMLFTNNIRHKRKDKSRRKNALEEAHRHYSSPESRRFKNDGNKSSPGKRDGERQEKSSDRNKDVIDEEEPRSLSSPPPDRKTETRRYIDNKSSFSDRRDREKQRTYDDRRKQTDDRDMMSIHFELDRPSMMAYPQNNSNTDRSFDQRLKNSYDRLLHDDRFDSERKRYESDCTELERDRYIRQSSNVDNQTNSFGHMPHENNYQTNNQNMHCADYNLPQNDPNFTAHNDQTFPAHNDPNFPARNPQFIANGSSNSFVNYPGSLVSYPMLHNNHQPETGAFPSNSYMNHSGLSFENDYDILRKENERLKAALVHIVSEPGDVKPEVQVIFKHEEMAGRFKSRIESFVMQLFESEGMFIQDVFAEKPLFITDDTSAANTLDTHSSVPLYEVDGNRSVDQENETNVDNNRSTWSTCFNCGGGHLLIECPQELCQRRIAENRAERSANVALQNTRYHASDGMLQGFYKPGVLSENLRAALSLGQNQLPAYVYRMRLLGYPPGWLEEAKVKSSGLSVYGLADDSAEDSHNENQKSGCKIEYDCEKFIDYPGFNIPLPPDVIDESNRFGLPPFQKSQMRSLMENSIEKFIMKPIRRKKPEPLSSQKPIPVESYEEEDMEVVDEITEVADSDMQIDTTDEPRIFQLLKDISTGVSGVLPPLPSSPFPPPPPPLPCSPPLPPDSPPPLPPEEEIETPASPDKPEDKLLHISSNNEAGSPLRAASVEYIGSSEDSSDTEIASPLSPGGSDAIAADSPILCIPLSPVESANDEEDFVVVDFSNADESQPPIPPKSEMEQRLLDSLADVDRPFKDSPSLAELEEKKRLIMLALTNDIEEGSDESIPSTEVEISRNDEIESNSIQEESCTDNIDSSQRSSESSSLLIGSPAVPSFSRVQRVPNIEKFGEGIQEHLPYENLPNATGTFDQMKKVLQGIREKMSKMYN